MKTTRNLLTILAVLLMTGCIPRIPFEAVGQIRVSGSQGSYTYVAYDDNHALLLTARHVGSRVGNEGTVEWMATGEKSECRVIDVVNSTSGFESDLCLVVCPIPSGLSPVEVAEFDPLNGPFTCVGYRGGQLYVSTAQIAVDEGGRIKLSSPLIGGMSGGPCFDRYGRLVAVGVGTGPIPNPTYGIAADGEYLKKLVDEYRQPW